MGMLNYQDGNTVYPSLPIQDDPQNVSASQNVNVHIRQFRASARLS